MSDHETDAMTMFPVRPKEVPAIEARLGIALPPNYLRLMANLRLQGLLALPALGMLDPKLGMGEFLDYCERKRQALTGLPPDAVVAWIGMRSGGMGRFSRFWLPDAKRPLHLGETEYSWDSQNRRAQRDCSNTSWLALLVDVVRPADADLLRELGFPAQPSKERKALRCHPLALDRESDGDGWRTVSPWTLSGSVVAVCDLGLEPQARDGVSVPLPPGDYELALRVEGQRVLALRLRSVGSSASALQQFATLDVDYAAVALYDRQRFFKRVRLDDRTEWVEDLCELSPCPYLAEGGRGLEVLVVPSGKGDGSYPVYLLQDATGPQGLQIDFG